jgi:hypothetical protein
MTECVPTGSGECPIEVVAGVTMKFPLSTSTDHSCTSAQFHMSTTKQCIDKVCAQVDEAGNAFNRCGAGHLYDCPDPPLSSVYSERQVCTHATASVTYLSQFVENPPGDSPVGTVVEQSSAVQLTTLNAPNPSNPL